MDRFQLLVFSVLCVTGISTTDFDYCDSSVCPEDPHVCCGQNDFDACCDRAEMIPLDRYQDLILDLSNEMRQKVASGQLKGFETASRMGVVSWYELFAKVAACNCKRCRFEHDKCRNTPGFKHAGQNIYTCMNTNRCRDPADAIHAAFQAWGDEYKQCNMKQIKSYYSSGGVGHFTQCVHDKSTLVGCALVQFWENEWCKLYFVCNYSETNMNNQPVYETGKTAADCKSGRHPKYWALCNCNEDYNNTSTMAKTTSKEHSKHSTHSTHSTHWKH